MGCAKEAEGKLGIGRRHVRGYRTERTIFVIGAPVPTKCLRHPYFPWELEAALRYSFGHHNNERYHESLDNVTPSGVHLGRQYEVLAKRAEIKRLTIKHRKSEYLAARAA